MYTRYGSSINALFLMPYDNSICGVKLATHDETAVDVCLYRHCADERAGNRIYTRD